MSPTGELLAVSERQALEFFALGLRDVSESSVDQEELLYNASVLAHYALVSTSRTVELPTPATLGDVFDHFVADEAQRIHRARLEHGYGAAGPSAGMNDPIGRERGWRRETEPRQSENPCLLPVHFLSSSRRGPACPNATAATSPLVLYRHHS